MFLHLTSYSKVRFMAVISLENIQIVPWIVCRQRVLDEGYIKGRFYLKISNRRRQMLPYVLDVVLEVIWLSLLSLRQSSSQNSEADFQDSSMFSSLPLWASQRMSNMLEPQDFIQLVSSELLSSSFLF